MIRRLSTKALAEALRHCNAWQPQCTNPPCGAGGIKSIQQAASFLDEYVSHLHYGDFTLGGYCSYVAELQQSGDRTHMQESAEVTYNEASDTTPAEAPAAKPPSQTAANTAAGQLAGQQAASLIGLGTFKASHNISHSTQSNKVAASAEVRRRSLMLQMRPTGRPNARCMPAHCKVDHHTHQL